jgi:hypothetical protein
VEGDGRTVALVKGGDRIARPNTTTRPTAAAPTPPTSSSNPAQGNRASIAEHHRLGFRGKLLR